jgi:hypothetical protein
MCRIWNLFFLQKLKGNTSANVRDFNNMKTLAVTNFFFLEGWMPKGIHAILTVTLEEYSPSYATVKNWVAQLKSGDFSTCVVPRPRRPKIVTITEIIDQIQHLNFEDCPISAKSIAEQLGISHGRVGSTIHEDLSMRKLPAYWVLKCPNADRSCQQCQSSEQMWNYFGALQLVSYRDWWPWTKPGYIPMNQRQSKFNEVSK